MNEDQAEEIEALKAIFEDEFEGRVFHFMQRVFNAFYINKVCNKETNEQMHGRNTGSGLDLNLE